MGHHPPAALHQPGLQRAPFSVGRGSCARVSGAGLCGSQLGKEALGFGWTSTVVLLAALVWEMHCASFSGQIQPDPGPPRSSFCYCAANTTEWLQRWADATHTDGPREPPPCACKREGMLSVGTALVFSPGGSGVLLRSWWAASWAVGFVVSLPGAE